MPRHKLSAPPRRVRLVTLLAAVFGFTAGLTVVVTQYAGPHGASTVALTQSSVSTRSYRHVGDSRHDNRGNYDWRHHQRQHHVSPSPSPSSSTPVPSSSPSSSPSTAQSSGSSSSPAPSTPPSGSSSPSPTPSPTSTQVMPTGVPASQVGKLLVNDTGDDLASWPRQQRGTGGTMTHSNGVLDLSTSGANANGYSIISPNSYTSGIFEARVYFPGAANGKIADWPAFWLSSAWSGAVSWPAGGEMDLAEGLGGDLCVTYHYGPNGTPESTMPFSVTSAPGWHVVTGVWSTGKWDIYYDGKLVKTISGVVVNDPMNIIFTAYQGNDGNQPGSPSTLKVSYLRIWSLAG
jgi:Glycosyl hydrolases family 16